MLLVDYETKKKQLEVLVTDRVTGHKVFVPFDLVEEIINNINIINDSKVAVLFNLEFVFVLLAQKNVKPSNITFFGDCLTKQALVELWGCNYVSITELNDTQLKEKYTMMFDVVLLNPPYQDGKNKVFYRQFVKTAWMLSTTVASITPASWNSAGMTVFKRDVITAGLKEYAYLGTTAFKHSQNDVCYFICEKGYTGDVVVKNITEQTTVSNVVEHGLMPHKNLAGVSILIKLSSFKGTDTLYHRGVVNPAECATGLTTFVYQNSVKDGPVLELQVDHCESVGFAQHKVVVAYNSSIGNIGPAKYVDPSYSIGYAVVCIPFDTKAECVNFAGYLESRLIKFVVYNLKTSIQNAKNVFEKIPLLDFTRNWTDAELYKHFKLTQEEIDYIEANVK